MHVTHELGVLHRTKWPARQTSSSRMAGHGLGQALSTGRRAARHTRNCQSTGRALSILTSVVGRSVASVCTLPSRLMVLIPPHTRPKMVCLPSSQGVGARVMKNWQQTHAQHHIR